MLTDLQNSFTITLSSKFAIKKSLNVLPSFTRVATLSCKTVVLKNRNYIVGLHYKQLMTMNNYTIKSFVVLIRTFLASTVNKSAYGQCVTKMMFKMSTASLHAS